MFGPLLAIAVFLGVFLGILSINFLITDLFKEDRSEQLKKMEADLRLQMREHARKVTAQQDIGDIDVGGQGGHFSILELIKQFKRSVDQAGLKVDPQIIGFIGLTGGSVVGVALYFTTGSILFAILAILAGVAFPILFIMFKRSQRLDQLGEQLPEALELMARTLRAGQTVPQAMNGVADEFPEPIGTEFGFCYEQQNLGLSLDTALHNLVERTGLIEIKVLVLSISVQRQAGGNLAELLGKLSDVMRQRQTLKGSVKALTAEGRMQAWVLFLLPFAAWVALFFINRPYAMKLLDHPNLIYATLGLMTVGLLWIRKIVNFDY